MLPEYRFDESLVKKYTAKIFGFALAKTGHRQNAEDLAQDIAMALLRSVRSGKEIANWDAWVHTICCYTWSNYLSKEKRHWNLVDLDDPYTARRGIQEQLSAGLEGGLERIAMEVAYLSKVHRDITIRYYYERQSVERIAGDTGIAPGTVKWHLFEARKKLKEGMNMNQTAEQLSFKPVRLGVGHSGMPGPKGEPNSYFQSLIASNICAAAYDKPLSVEEIARAIGVASAYVEDEIAKYEKSDLLLKTGKGKYRTNFIIDTMDSYAQDVVIRKEWADKMAGELYGCISSRLDDIRAIGFHGCHLNDTFLLWAFIPYAIGRQYGRVKEPDYYKRYQPEERKDGGKYIVSARMIYEPSEYERRIPDYGIVRKYVNNGIKSRNNGKYYGLQMETWWSGLGWRDFNAPDIADMARIVDLMESGAEHGEYDKLLISRMVEKGFVSM
ncbi:RNA polymerase sigma factor [Paenibacillus mesophilus]|uniref:RNA polymerase sigma factor n=1 Tax=Paenibacillus mesophilus TaxID=2582849 RepID=UPI00110E1510|nr:RNA polymerase sigma factor [Paenibacillus mesophilus]TMV43823.1 RNA polymerase sigma factor [Paenibacillus mesophilus]